MTSQLTQYEIFAIKYAFHNRKSPSNFIGGDTHDQPMPLDYFVWVLRSGKRVVLVDTGFDHQGADHRGRTITHPVDEGLRQLDIAPEAIRDIIITHMHYDHAGNREMFPNARYHLQDREMAYCTGRCMCQAILGHPFEPEDVKSMVGHVFEGRVEFHDGDSEVASGITVHRVGGHTDGLQVVRVNTARGWVVLASDASHFYANMEQGRPFPVVYNVGDMLEGYKIVHRLASSPNHVVPGHDPQVLQRYPAHSPETEGWIARLDLDPRSPH